MKLEFGKYYRTRDGRKVGPLLKWSDEAYHWEGSDDSCLSDGRMFCREYCNDDLIAEWIDTLEVGTLKEIGAQVGDMVQQVGYEPYLAPLTQREIDTDIRGGFRIISRANQPIPVRTVTTTRLEIVPGVYGRICVSTADNNQVALKLTHQIGEYAMLDVDEMDALLATLTAIRDAMQASTTS